MTKRYYVIVDYYDLSYQRNGYPVKLEEADKFETLKDAKTELKTYDNDSDCVIYEVLEHTTIQLRKAEEEQ